ncbi:unnamed protein product, partial [marine sediment metagenome]
NKNYNEPMNGYFPGSYGFENDIPGNDPSGWSITEPGTGGHVEVDANLEDHNNIVELRKKWCDDKGSNTKGFFSLYYSWHGRVLVI